MTILTDNGLSEENAAFDLLGSWDRLSAAIERVICALPSQMTEASAALEAQRHAFREAIQLAARSQGRSAGESLLASQSLRSVPPFASDQPNMHTPGPWVIIDARPYDGDDAELEGSFETFAGIEGGDGSPVCVFGDAAGSATMFGNEADYHLIAAAPGLLEVLRSQAGWIRHWLVDFEHGLKPTREALEQSLAKCEGAIAKARK